MNGRGVFYLTRQKVEQVSERKKHYNMVGWLIWFSNGSRFLHTPTSPTHSHSHSTTLSDSVLACLDQVPTFNPILFFTLFFFTIQKYCYYYYYSYAIYPDGF